ncbi:MAG: hypothetical protein K5696_04975 [Lachnospiraceae bacterium]|nr:hypothetical protein [Lachnospiraceae bacterium]
MNALKIASKYRDFSPEEVDDLTVRFYVRLALAISNGGSEEEALRIMRDAAATTVTNLYLKILDYTSLS